MRPDGSRGERQAVALLHEAEVRDYMGKASADQGRDIRVHERFRFFAAVTAFHVTIPYHAREAGVVEWWARTIHPDGSVVEMARGAMKEVQDELEGWTLEGVVPDIPAGSVLDLGYTLRQRGGLYIGRAYHATLPVPARQFRLRWLPARGLGASLVRTGLDPFPVEVKVVGADFEAQGRDLPAMEALQETGAEPLLWLTYPPRSPAEHWTLVAKEEDDGTERFLQYDKPIAEAVASLGLPSNTSLDTKLRAAYVFLEKKVRIAGLETEAEARAAGDPGRRPGVVLRDGRAWASDQARLLVGFARHLGADAAVVLVWNQRWEPGLAIPLTPAGRMVAVRPANDPDASWSVLAPGWNLPYGVLPHPFAGTRGLLARKGGITVVELPSPTGPSSSEIRGTVTVSTDGAKPELRFTWTWTGTGQEGLLTRRWLQGLRTDLQPVGMARKCAGLAAAPGLISLERLLDAGTTEGNAPTLYDPAAPFELQCTTRISLPAQTFNDVWNVRFGPQRRVSPDVVVDPSSRRSLFQLPYPVEHTSVLEVQAPEGFVAGEAPAEVRVEAACCGSYVRTVVATGRGFRVERKLALPKLRMPASQAAAFREFLEKVEEADQTTLPFKKP